jgi:hypothetical protein
VFSILLLRPVTHKDATVLVHMLAIVPSSAETRYLKQKVLMDVQGSVRSRSNPESAAHLIARSYVSCQQSALAFSHPHPRISNYTFPRPLEEEPHNENLQSRHGHNESTLHQAKIENALLGALDSRKVAVLARAKVLLVAGDCGQLCRKLEDGFFEDGSLLGGGTLLRGNLCAGCFVFDLRG